MKKMRRIITLVLTLALIMGSVVTVSTPASAKVTGTKKFTMYVGRQAKWTIFGAGGKKVTFKTSNKKIATISKKGIIKAKKKGKCTLTAKVGKQTLKCKLTVKSNKVTTPKPITTPVPTAVPTPTPVPETIINNQLAANMVVTKTILPSGKLLYSVTNNNTSQVYETILNMVYYSADGAPVKTDNDYLFYMDPAETRYVVINAKENVDFSKTVTSVTCKYSQYTSKSKLNVTVTAQPNADGDIIVTCVNPNAVKAELNGIAFFKDASGAVIDAREFGDYIEPGATVFSTVRAPYDANYDKLAYSTYELLYYADTYNN